MRRTLLFLVFTALVSSVAAQAKHPFTFEDMMKLKRVGDPQVSPDGKWVLFSVVDVDLAANTKTLHVWIVPLSEKAGSSPATGGLGMTSEREIIADQDADRPRWAPDGKRFAFLSTKEGGSQVWIADFDATNGTVTHKTKWTSIATEAGGELWSPDGSNILFTSDVYPNCTFDDRGEAICNRVMLEAGENGKVKAQIFDHLLYRHWNAYKDGKRTHIFVVSTTLAQHAVAQAQSKPALMQASLRLQPGTTPNNQAQQQSPQPGQVPVESGTRMWSEPPPPRDLTPGDYDAPVFSLGGQDNYAFSPDGKEICYASNHDKNPAASTNNDLWIVPVNIERSLIMPAGSGVIGVEGSAQRGYADDWVKTVLAHTKNITADNPASDTSPLYSPDGRYIAYRAQQRPGYESDRFRLMLYDRKTGKREATEADELDRWIGAMAWSPDSSRIYFTTENAGNAPIIELGVGGTLNGRRWPVKIAAGFNDDLAVSPDGKTLLFTRMSLQAPTEIYSAPIHFSGCSNESATRVSDCGVPSTPLTHLNDSVLAQISMSPLEPLWFTGAHGDKVEGFLVKPPNFDASKKYPVKFLIHGGPQGAWGDDWSYRWNAELFAAPTSAQSSGYVVIMINFHGSTGYGQKFIDAINGDWGGAPYEDLMKGLDYAEQTYPFIDKNRECALGASYGGYMINWVEGHTDRFKCLVSHDGMFNAESAWGTTEELWFNDWEFKGTPYGNREMYRKWSPHEYAKNFKTPMLVIHGQRDYRLDVSQGFDLFTTLQMEGIPSKMLYFPDEGHWVLKPQNSQLWYKTVNDWVDQWVGDQWIGK